MYSASNLRKCCSIWEKRLLFFSPTHCRYLTYPGGPSPLAKRKHVALITVTKIFKDHDLLYETLFVQLTYICPCKVHGKKGKKKKPCQL